MKAKRTQEVWIVSAGQPTSSFIHAVYTNERAAKNDCRIRNEAYQERNKTEQKPYFYTNYPLFEESL